jgi:hypothetical protein
MHSSLETKQKVSRSQGVHPPPSKPGFGTSSSSYISPARSLCNSNKSTQVLEQYHQTQLRELCSFPEPGFDNHASTTVPCISYPTPACSTRTCICFCIMKTIIYYMRVRPWGGADTYLCCLLVLLHVQDPGTAFMTFETDANATSISRGILMTLNLNLGEATGAHLCPALRHQKCVSAAHMLPMTTSCCSSATVASLNDNIHGLSRTAQPTYGADRTSPHPRASLIYELT